jgi:hypothetical protein
VDIVARHPAGCVAVIHVWPPAAPYPVRMPAFVHKQPVRMMRTGCRPHVIAVTG